MIGQVGLVGRAGLEAWQVVVGLEGQLGAGAGRKGGKGWSLVGFLFRAGTEVAGGDGGCTDLL